MRRLLGVATVVLAALLVMSSAARAGGNTWDRALSVDTNATKRKQGTPPPELQGFDREIWLGDYHTKSLARSRRALVTQRSRLLLFRAAHSAYEKALSARPKSAEAHLRMAELIFAGYTDGGSMNRRPMPVVSARQWRRQAIHHWEQFQKLAPRDPRLGRMLLFTRALEYTRLGTVPALRAAVRDYAHLAATRLAGVTRREAGIITSNRAEVHMMLGEMSEAVTWYRRAFEYGKRASWAFGLAVAYDRDGQGLRAREKLRRWVTRANLERFAAELAGGNTFFVPRGEVHYYFGLIHEVNGNYDLAYRAYDDFIKSGAHPTFQPRARENLSAMRAMVKQHGRSLLSAKHWSRTWHLAYTP